MRIAVFWPNWIGDAVMATPAVQALREHHPDAYFLGILRPAVSGVLEGSPWMDGQAFLDTRDSWSRRWPAVARRLWRERIDLAVLFPNSFHAALVAWLGRCRRRVGYARYGRSRLLTDPLEPIRDDRNRLQPSPAIQAYNRLAESVGCDATSHGMQLFTTRQNEAAAEAVWQEAGFIRHAEVICLNPGAAFGPAKQWPTEHFAVLARDLVDGRGCGVLVLCGPGEQDLARRIVTRAARPQVHSLAAHHVSLGLTKACIRRADLLITTDSGPRHFAAAFDRPVITLFGPTHIAWTETYHAKAVHLQRKVDCGPCQRRICPLDHRCMKLLTPAEVFAAANDLLTRFPRSSPESRLQAAG